MDVMKLEKIYASKEYQQKKNQLTEQEKIFAMQVSDKRLRSSMYRELLKCNKTTDKNLTAHDAKMDK